MRLMGLRDCVGVVTKIFSLGSPTRLNWAGLIGSALIPRWLVRLPSTVKSSD
jgi:hypothetical protein